MTGSQMFLLIVAILFIGFIIFIKWDEKYEEAKKKAENGGAKGKDAEILLKHEGRKRDIKRGR